MEQPPLPNQPHEEKVMDDQEAAERQQFEQSVEKEKPLAQELLEEMDAAREAPIDEEAVTPDEATLHPEPKDFISVKEGTRAPTEKDKIYPIYGADQFNEPNAFAKSLNYTLQQAALMDKYGVKHPPEHYENMSLKKQKKKPNT